MTPQEHGEAHALLVKAVTDPDWHASQALDELMGKLVVMHRLLEAEGASLSARHDVVGETPVRVLTRPAHRTA